MTNYIYQLKTNKHEYEGIKYGPIWKLYCPAFSSAVAQ